MHRLFRRLQQRNRWVDEEPTTGLNLADAHFITEVGVNPNHTQGSLGELFFLPQSYMSRMMKGLKKRGLIAVKPSLEDKRVSKIALTPAGRKLLAESDVVTSRRFASFASKMTLKERHELVAYFKAIADGYGHPSDKLRPGELEFQREQRRITRCFRLLGNTVFGSDLTSTEWQVLSEISLSVTPPTAALVAANLGLSAATMSMVLSRFQKKGWVVRTKSAHDRRASHLSLSERGRKVVAGIEGTAASELRQALRTASPAKQDRWLKILERYVTDTDPSRFGASELGEIVFFDSEEERRVARTFLVESIVRRGWAEFCPETLVGRGSIVVGIKTRELKAVFNIQNVSNRYLLIAAGFSDDVAAGKFSVYLSALQRALRAKIGRGELRSLFSPVVV